MCIRRATLVIGFAFAWSRLGPASATIEDDGACPLFILLPFTSTYEVPPSIKRSSRNQYNPWTASISAQISYSYAAAALLAIEHWNTRNAAVVPELAEIDDGCSVYFPDPKFADSLTDGDRSVPAFFEATDGDKRRPCAILAPLEQEATFKLQSISAALDMPMLVHFIENDLFAEEDSISPGTVTMSLSAPGRARAMVQYLQSREYFNIASWRSNRNQDMLLAEMIETIGEEMFNLSVALFVVEATPPDQDEDEFVMESLRQLKDNGITTIFLTSVKEPYKLPQLALYLDQLGMLSNDYFYILPPALLPPTFSNTTTSKALEELYGEQVPGSPLDKLLSGSVVFDSMDGFEVSFQQTNNTDSDPFLKAWNQQGLENVQKLNELVPPNWLNANPDYFQVVKPSRGSSFVYDSVMAIGFGGCTKQRMDHDTVWPPIKDPDAPPPDLDLGPGFLAVVEPDPSQSNEFREWLGEQNIPNQTTNDKWSVIPDAGAGNSSLRSEERGDTQHFDVPQESPRPSPVKEDFPEASPSITHMPAPAIEPTVNNGENAEETFMNPSTEPSPKQSLVPSNALPILHSQMPLSEPNLLPSSLPNVLPSDSPTVLHSPVLSTEPSQSQSLVPSLVPSDDPTMLHSEVPSNEPSLLLTSLPSLLPCDPPTVLHSTDPSTVHSQMPSSIPTLVPSDGPTVLHSEVPLSEPSFLPSILPSDSPTVLHSTAPSTVPSQRPSSMPRLVPSDGPTVPHSEVPSSEHDFLLSSLPSLVPSDSPTVLHSTVPSTETSQSPSSLPSSVPSDAPTVLHSEVPSIEPSLLLTSLPSLLPSDPPTVLHSTDPTTVDSQRPSSIPTLVPSDGPTVLHSEVPSSEPSFLPSILPSDSPTVLHSTAPFTEPSKSPSSMPSMVPSDGPTVPHSEIPSGEPTLLPSSLPSLVPSDSPTVLHSTVPSTETSHSPSSLPNSVPSDAPTVLHSQVPSSEPSLLLSSLPSGFPSDSAIVLPSNVPSTSPSESCTAAPWFDVLNPSGSMGYLDCFVLDLGSYGFASIGFSLNIPFTGQTVNFYLDGVDLGPPSSISGGTYTIGPSIGLLSYLQSLSPGAHQLSATAFPAGFLFWADFELIPARRLQSTMPKASASLLSSILESKFSGASGLVEFGKEYEKGRNYVGITVGIYNIRPNEVNSETGKRSYSSFLISTWNEELGWADVPGAALVYRDGSNMFSGVYRRIFNAHYITPRVRLIGLVFMAIAWMVALASLGLLSFLRKESMIQQTQPISMHIICLGSIITSATVFTVSFDEAANWTNQQLSVACSLSPWFFFVGHLLIFGGLFIRLWQFDCALQFRLAYTTIPMSLWSLALLLMASLSILLVHTLYDPWSWERHIISEMPAETYGKCQSEHAWAFFVPLVGLLFVAEAITLFLAWKTVDMKSEFQDSSSVMYACFAHIQAWSIGGPMLIFIGYSSADATYFARIFLIWIFSLSGVVLVVVPKLYKAIQHHRDPQYRKAGRRVAVSTIFLAEGNANEASSRHGISQKFDSISMRSRTAVSELSHHHQGAFNSGELRLIQEEDFS